jgi:hypothetical protein
MASSSGSGVVDVAAATCSRLERNSASRPAHSSVNRFRRTRSEIVCGHGSPDTMSYACVRTVSVPSLATMKSL